MTTKTKTKPAPTQYTGIQYTGTQYADIRYTGAQYAGAHYTDTQHNAATQTFEWQVDELQRNTGGGGVPDLLLKQMHEHSDVPCFIAAPQGFGRSTLALYYSKMYFGVASALWFDGSADSFTSVLKSGVLAAQVARFQPADGADQRLLIIDDLVHLDEPEAALLSDFIDGLIEHNWACVVILDPLDDVFSNLQSDRFLLGAAELAQCYQPPIAVKHRCVEHFVRRRMPREFIDLAGLVLALGRASIAMLQQLGLNPRMDTIELLCHYCPVFAYNADRQTISAQDLPVELMAETFIELFGGREQAFEQISRAAILLLDCDQRQRSHTLFDLGNAFLRATDQDAGSAVGSGTVEDVVAVTEDTFSSAKTVNISVPSTRFAAEVALSSKRCSVRGIEPLVIRLFSDLEIWRGNDRLLEPVLTRSKVRTLLIYLTLNLRRGMSRETILRKLWPDMDQARATENFYVAWSKLNKALKPQGADKCPYLIQTSSMCKLAAEFVQSDTVVFEGLSRQVLFGERKRDETLESIYQMERLFSDSQLTGNPHDAYLQEHQQRFRSMLVEALLVGSGIYEQEGDAHNALWFARKAFDTDPCREDVYRVLMEMQSLAGQRTSAIKTYFACRQYLASEFGVLPSQKTSLVFQDLLLECG